jgi:hypothetical protein
MTDQLTTAAPADPFTAALTLIALAADPKAIEKRLAELKAASTQLERMAATRADHDRRLAEIEKREAAALAREGAADVKEFELKNLFDHRRDELRALVREMHESEQRMIYRIAHHHDLLQDYNPGVQSPPTWANLDQMLADIRRDAHFTEQAEGMFTTEAVDTAPAGSALTRSVPATERRSSRRASAR